MHDTAWLSLRKIFYKRNCCKTDSSWLALQNTAKINCWLIAMERPAYLVNLNNASLTPTGVLVVRRINVWINQRQAWLSFRCDLVSAGGNGAGSHRPQKLITHNNSSLASCNTTVMRYSDCSMTCFLWSFILQYKLRHFFPPCWKDQYLSSERKTACETTTVAVKPGG